jgi:Ca-activated chloride channel homolog
MFSVREAAMKKQSWFQAVRASRFTSACVLLSGLLVGFQLTPAACGQTCAQCAISEALPPQPVSAGEWSFTKEVDEVNVLFVAMHGGRFIDDLSPNDVTVLDDKKPPAVILGFRTERELPLRVGLVIDTSGSVTSRFKFEKQGAGAFVHQALQSERDQAFVMGFSDSPKVSQDFVNDPKTLSRAVQGLTIGGGTALYDAVAAGCQKLLATSDRDMTARVLVILSDGQNNAGQLGLDAAIDLAQQAQVVIYAVSTNYQYLTDQEDWDATQGNKNLRRLAEETGGRMFKPAVASEVGKAFAKVAEELRSRYAIAYRPADFRADGHYRKITIAAHRAGENLKVRARKGYYAKLVTLANNKPWQQ